MKTLKRTLCLVLVLCMVVGVLAVSASATFTDDDKITYKTAVEVMSGLGIISGYTDGSFKPSGTLTREEGAKLLVYALVTPSVAAKLPANATKFSDVSGTRWSSGIINYASEQGIILGVGDGKFAPTGTLTGVQFAKMLLVALGVDGDFTSSAWASNTVVAAEKIGLSDGMTGFSYYNDITREEACQLLWNALNYSETAATVTYVVTLSGVVLYQGTNETAAYLIATSNTGSVLSTAKQTADSLGYTKYGLTATTGSDDFGRPKTTYKKGTTTIYTEYDTPVLTYTTSVSQATIYSALGLASNTSYTTYTDGLADTQVITKGSSTAVDGSGRGVLTEVYDIDGNGTYRIVIINTYVGTVSKVTAATSSTDRSVTIAQETLGAVASPVGGLAVTATYTFTTDDFALNNTVLFTATNDGTEWTIRSAELATVVSAVKISSTKGTVNNAVKGANGNTGSVVAGGSTYNFNAKNITDGTITASTTNTYNLVLDSYGNVVWAKAYSASASYLYVLAKGTGGLISTTYYAQVVLEDGTINVVEVSADATSLVGTICSYTVSGDVYYLTDLSANVLKTATATPDIIITNGKIGVSTSNATTVLSALYANSSTVYVAGTLSDGFTSYTGYVNAPSITSTQFALLYDSDKIVVVFAVGNPSGSTGSVFVTGLGRSSGANTSGSYYEYNAVVDGEITTIKALTTNPLDDSNYYIASSLTTNSSGFVTTNMLGYTYANNANKVTSAYSNGIIFVNGVAHAVSSSCQVFLIDIYGNITKGVIADVEANDYVITSYNAANTALATIYCFMQ